MTQATVLKDFHYAHDRRNPELLRAGWVGEFREDAVEGLKEQGLIQVEGEHAPRQRRARKSK